MFLLFSLISLALRVQTFKLDSGGHRAPFMGTQNRLQVNNWKINGSVGHRAPFMAIKSLQALQFQTVKGRGLLESAHREFDRRKGMQNAREGSLPSRPMNEVPNFEGNGSVGQRAPSMRGSSERCKLRTVNGMGLLDTAHREYNGVSDARTLKGAGSVGHQAPCVEEKNEPLQIHNWKINGSVGRRALRIIKLQKNACYKPEGERGFRTSYNANRSSASARRGFDSLKTQEIVPIRCTVFSLQACRSTFVFGLTNTRIQVLTLNWNGSVGHQAPCMMKSNLHDPLWEKNGSVGRRAS
ncbi:hypothetical protein DFH06DRAFT_1136251 [Mycena polygramma]|nr:hypothetical protein DFH06DRAFT_1136251 [Mycena polygramma]